jgi:hypothetical protein
MSERRVGESVAAAGRARRWKHGRAPALLLAAGALAGSGAGAGVLEPHPDLDRIQAVAPNVDPQLLSDALQAVDCARSSAAAAEQIAKTSILAMIDYSLPSSQRRFWVVDLSVPALLFEEYVAHGAGSGDNLPFHFSNVKDTRASSLGLYRAAEVYKGRHGDSIRLDGLTPGWNDRARARSIVMHSASYVSEEYLSEHGQLGRSWGCPAFSTAAAKPIIDTLRDGGWVYVSAGTLEWRKYVRAAPPCGSSGVSSR